MFLQSTYHGQHEGCTQLHAKGQQLPRRWRKPPEACPQLGEHNVGLEGDQHLQQPLK